ncbi:Hypothetical predicted protein, partial [Pelobates cultripes]
HSFFTAKLTGARPATVQSQDGDGSGDDREGSRPQSPHENMHIQGDIFQRMLVDMAAKIHSTVQTAIS